MKNFKLKNLGLTNLNGILAILFGVIALVFPSITVFALVIYFAISVLIGGIILLVNSIRVKNINPNWRFLLFEGIIGILFGAIILSRPELAAVVLLTIIGIWSLIVGLIFSTVYFISSVPKEIRNIYLAAGITSLLFGLLIVFNPFESPRAVIILIALYAITYGMFSISNNSRTY
jgi:uncharacterized membrane protein HdeD (DUF308 family)